MLPRVIQDNLAPFLSPAMITGVYERQESPLLGFVAGGMAHGKELRVAVPSTATGFNNWCWAAVAVGIAEAYRDSPISQCEVASKVQGIRCCSQPPDPDSDHVQPLSPALSLEGHDHFVKYLLPDRTAALLVPQVGWSFLTDHIDRGLPVPVRIAFGSGVHEYGHFVVVTGYRAEESGLTLIVWDPAGGRGYYELGGFISHYQSSGRWNVTYELKPPDVIPAIP